MTLYELIEDLHALRARTQAYERKYGVTSRDFELYQQGLLDDEGLAVHRVCALDQRL